MVKYLSLGGERWGVTQGVTSTAEIYDPLLPAFWTLTGSMQGDRTAHTATISFRMVKCLSLGAAL